MGPHAADRLTKAFAQQVEGGRLDLDRFPAWSRWLTDAAHTFEDGRTPAFVGVALPGDRLFGACAGHARAYLVNEAGCHVLHDDAAPRLDAAFDVRPIHLPLTRDDTVVLLSDGAWHPLPPAVLHRLVMAARLEAFADLPTRLLEAASRHGRIDDMTAVALRLA